jgi:glycine cleavage system P protein (glycine dehydrogenase) subunit 1
MRFIPHTPAELAEMLAVVGARELDDLIAHIPLALRAKAALDLPPGMDEAQVAGEIAALAARNPGADRFTSFLGYGYYRHYVPAAVRSITARAEFATSYTPYQPEASQGTTQAIFEFQTLITQLTGLEVANASMYDGASAAAEAVLMSRRVLPKRRVVALSRGLWPQYRETIRTYLSAQAELEVVEVPFERARGTCDLAALEQLADDRLLCVVAGYPNAFGVIEPLRQIAALSHRAGGLAIAVTAEPLALGLLSSPGELGADLAVGEAQSFGIALQFGGPGLGYLAARSAHLRQLPGRLVGMTTDRNGRRAFCLTLATREQHIRREKATSNICTNHSLCALAATVYLTLMGSQGLRELAGRNIDLAHEAQSVLENHGMRPCFSAPFFNEFVVALADPVAALVAARARGILAGVILASDYPEIPEGVLISVTELNARNEFALLADALQEGN